MERTTTPGAPITAPAPAPFAAPTREEAHDGASRHPAPSGTGPHDDVPWWKEPPLRRQGWLILLAGYVAMTAVLTGIGLLVVNVWEDSSLGDADADVNRWFEERRTESWDTLSDYGSMLSDTLTKVILGAVLLPVFLLLFKRWQDWVFVVGGLVLEVTTFVSVATLVGRERPPVEQLDSAPTNSFPSGHIAAAVVFYVGLAIVVCWHTRNRLVRGVFVLIAIVAPLSVITSRLYRGMHYPTDAVAGVALGLTTLLIVAHALRRSTDRPLSTVE
jgi:undecaprenyl-diphosphatase